MGMMVFTCWGFKVMIGKVLLAFKGASHLARSINWEIERINSDSSHACRIYSTLE